tara:strand:+ start:2586 stop:3401 length:816 start_codon:yes stop_codon:yes gene_type:complete
MKYVLLLEAFLLSSSYLICQTLPRLEVQGIILVDNNDVEGVTIFNTSSNKGTITNDKGEFVIDVSLNDRIEISALQFHSTSLIINEEVINSKRVKIYLAEQVNQLDAVLLSAGLIGNMAVDIDNVKMIEPIELNMGNMNIPFEYNDDKAFDNQVVSDALNSVVNKDQFYNGIDFVQIVGGLFSLFIKPKQKKTNIKDYSTYKKTTDITDIYSYEYISENFNIPLDKMENFIAVLDFSEKNSELLKSKNELMLFEFLLEQSKLFLKANDDKN